MPVLASKSNDVLVIVILSIVGFLLFLLAINLFFLVVFSRRIKRNQRALTIIIATKYRYLKKVFEIYHKTTGELDPKIQEVLKYINLLNLEDPASSESRDTVNKLTYLRNEMDFVTKKDVLFQKHEEFIRAKTSVEEMDVVYQRAIASYNNDINGYNYWIRFLPYRWLFVLLKAKKKEII